MIDVYIIKDDIKDPFASEISLNLLDITVEGFITNCRDIDHVYIGRTVDALIEKCKSSNARWGLFLQWGQLFDCVGVRNMINMLHDEPTTTTLIGHILDRKERYYELNNQMFILNLETMQHALGEKRPMAYQNVDRSITNFHDDYTPKEVWKGDGHVAVANPANGAYIVSAAISRGNVRPFNDEERSWKRYLYPHHDFAENVSHLETVISRTRNQTYFYNTEDFLIRKIKSVGPLRRMILPASGFLPFELAREATLLDGFRFVLYDCSLSAVQFYRKILKQWDGNDPRTLIPDIPKNSITPPPNSDEFDQQWIDMMDRFGGKSEWLSLFNHIIKTQSSVVYADITAAYNWGKFTTDLNKHPDETFISLSNIYFYTPSSIMRSYNSRITKLQKYVDWLKQHYPNVWLYYATASPRHSYFGEVQNHSKIVDAIETTSYRNNILYNEVLTYYGDVT